ncbi:uncharacterized protein LOC118146675 [Callithrix jacchus]
MSVLVQMLMATQIQKKQVYRTPFTHPISHWLSSPSSQFLWAREVGEWRRSFAFLPRQKLPAWEPGGERATFPFIIRRLQAQTGDRGSERAGRDCGPRRPRRRDERERACGRLRSPAPRRAPLCPRARSSRPAHSPASSRRAFPRPPAAGGGGGARPANPSSAGAQGGGASAGVLAPSSAGCWGRRGGARGSEGRCPAGRAPRRVRAVPTPTTVHCGGASRGGHELGRRGSASARAGPPPGRSPSPLACPRGPRGSPAPSPAPAHALPRSHRAAPLAAAVHPGAGWCSRARRERASSGPPRQPPAAPAPASPTAQAPSAPQPALTCSLAQPQTLPALPSKKHRE